MEILGDKTKLTSRRYLGSKTKLLPFIHQVFEEENITFFSFLDIFGGTGAVANSFNDGNHAVYVNDILESNRCSYNAFFGNQAISEMNISSLIAAYNSLCPKSDNYFSRNFGGTFFSVNNARKIGEIREDIEKRFSKGELNQRERDILITVLLYSADRIANTVGHYDAFRHGGNLERDLVLRMLELPKEGINKNNKVFREDANELAKTIEADVVYIDPPYNSRQYCDAYHLLENLAEWKKPDVYGMARKMDRSHLKSRYCETNAPRVFCDLIQNLRCKYIVVSYNNMGAKGAGRSQAKISDADIIRNLERRGKVTIREISFNQFTTGKTHVEDHKERLFVCHVGVFETSTPLELPGYAKSPLNYTGGKFRLLKPIFALCPTEQHTFVDLFGGGFNVGVNCWCKDVVYNDISEPTMRVVRLFYKYSSPEILGKLEHLISKYGLSDSQTMGYDHYGCSSDKGLGPANKDGFLKAKTEYNLLRKSEEKDFLLLLLIIFAFNNQIRFNSKDQYNLPVGKRDLNSAMRKHIQDFSEKIKTKNVLFLSKDFASVKPEDYDNPFFYCDPPYLLGDASYNENGGWGPEKEERLLDYLSSLSQRGYKFALSNVIEHKGFKHQALIDWALENHFTIHYLDMSYSNSNYQIKDKTKSSVEVLITNY